MADEKTFRVIIWGVPRSISTCLLKCLSFLPNTQAWFEPYCLAFFTDISCKKMGFPLPRYARDFNAEAFAESMASVLKGSKMEKEYAPGETDASLVIRDSVRNQLDSLPPGKSHVIKDMAYAVTGFYDTLPCKESNFKHVFLIRRPECMFPSFRRLLMVQLKNMTMMRGEDPGNSFEDENFDMTTDVPFMMPGYMYKCQFDLWKYVRENIDPNPVIIDSDELANHPAELLPKLCEATGMPYDPSLLEWDSSPDCSLDWRCLHPLKKKDGTLRGPYHMALHSTCFNAPRPLVPRDDMTPDMIKCVDATQDYYNEMAAHRIKPNP
nr:uncharacterized protein LOC129277952 [Lytechinus pictus]